MPSLIQKFKPEMQKAIDRLQQNLGSLRTGRASAALIENIQVSVYGTEMPLKGIASISIPDAKTLLVEPWDKNNLKAIEAKISAESGLIPVSDGTKLRITIPPLTEESRKELTRLVKDKLEDTRATIRTIREKAKSALVSSEEKKEITEDEFFRLQDELDKMTSEFNEKIKTMGEEKEKEIMII